MYLPGLALSRLLPSVFPIHLRLRWALPLLQVPLDAIILHSLHLRSLESVKHGARELLQRWLFLATRTLGLSRLLLPLYIPYELDARRRICFPRHVRSWLEAVEQAHAHMPAVPHRLRRLPAHASAACRRQQIRGTAPPPEADIRGDRLGRTLWQRLTRARRAAAHAQPQPQARQARSPQSIRRGPGRDGAAGAFRGTSADLVEVLDATGTALVRYVHDRATQLGMRGSRWASHEERPGAAEGAWGAGKAADPTSAGLPREGCTPPARVAVAHMPVLDDVAPNAYGPGGAGAIEQVVVVGPSSAILHRGLAGLPLGDWAFGRVPHNQAPALRPLPPGAADLEGVAEEVARHPEEGVDADEQGPAAVDEADVPDPVGAAGLRRRRGNGAEGEGEDAGGADAPAGPAGAGEEDHPPSPRPGHTFLLPEQLPPAVELAQLVQTPAAPLQLRLLAVRRGPPTRALLRWVALALSTWVAVVVVAALLSAIPLLLGRSLLHCLCIPEQMAHDPLALVLGFFLMGRVFALCDTAALAATRAMGSMRRAARRRARLGRALRRRLRRAMRGNGRQTTVSAAAAAEEAVQEEEAAVAAARHARRRGPAQATGLRCGEGMEGAVEVASPTMRDGRTFLRRWVAHLLVPVDADPLFEAQRGRYGGNVRRVVEAYAARTERAHGRPLLRSLSAAASSRAAALVHAFLVAAVVTPLALALLWRACVAGPIVGAVVPLDSWSTEVGVHPLTPSLPEGVVGRTGP